ncbi:uncharacterized protein LOC144159859 [Haemaphysalis longicornis]
MEPAAKEGVVSPPAADMTGALSSTAGEKHHKKQSKKRVQSPLDEGSALEQSEHAGAKGESPEKEAVTSPQKQEVTGTLATTTGGKKRHKKQSKKRVQSPNDEDSALEFSGHAGVKGESPEKEAVTSPQKKEVTGTLVTTTGGKKPHKTHSKEQKDAGETAPKELGALEFSDPAQAPMKSLGKGAVVSPSTAAVTSPPAVADETPHKKPSKHGSTTGDDATKETPAVSKVAQIPGKPEGAKTPEGAGAAIVSLDLPPAPASCPVPAPALAGGNIAQKPGDLPDTEKKEMITNTLPIIEAVVLVIGLMVVIVVGLLVIPHPSPTDSAAVSTTSGDFVGEKFSVHGVEVYRWLGIPYAESTAGKNRFQMPVPSTVKRRTMANESRPPCAQWVNGKVVGSEDCLHMNVWAPIRSRAAGSNRTLVLASSSYWFQRSSDNDTYWSELAAKAGVVVMSPNLRLGVLGFLHAGSMPVQDVAKEDAKAALNWSVTNAAAFGARPDGIALVGSGSGAYMLTQAVQRLNISCRRAILEGPVPGSLWPLNTGELEPSKALTASLGCPDGAADTPLPCLVNASLQDLTSHAAHMEFRFAPALPGFQSLEKDAQPVIAEVIAGVDIGEVRSFFAEYVTPAAVATGDASTPAALFSFTLDYFLKNGSSAYKYAKDLVPVPPTVNHIFNSMALLMVGCDTRRLVEAAVKGYHYVTDGAGRPLFEPVLDMDAVASFLKEGTLPKMKNGDPWEPWQSNNTTRIELAADTVRPTPEEIENLCLKTENLKT